MWEFLAQYAPDLAYILLRSVGIATVALALVYATGRMLDIVVTPRLKNLVALLTISWLSWWSTSIYDAGRFDSTQELYWWSLVYASVAVIIYVLIGFDLYDRFNAWCDRKFGPPDSENKPKQKRKDKSKK